MADALYANYFTIDYKCLGRNLQFSRFSLILLLFCIKSLVKLKLLVYFRWKRIIQLDKGKFHGTVDTGLSVIACKKKGRRIDVDADDLIYHLKVFIFHSYIFILLLRSRAFNSSSWKFYDIIHFGSSSNCRRLIPFKVLSMSYRFVLGCFSSYEWLIRVDLYTVNINVCIVYAIKQ